MDTARGDRCSVNGYERPTTTALEALAKEGVTYTNCWSPAGWTGPAHASLFTGLRPENHGFMSGVRLNLPDRAETLAERFRAAGYRTANLTSNEFVTSRFGLAQGFEKTELFSNPDRPGDAASAAAHAVAIRFARQSRVIGRPFFIFVNDMDPHLPYTPPRERERAFARGSTSEEERTWARAFDGALPLRYVTGTLPIGPDRWRTLSDLYDAEIANLDSLLAALFEGLRAQGLLDDTILLITSDHGENLGEHGLASHIFSLHRTILHVPLLIRYPKRFAPGTRVADVVRLEDLYPTLLEACGIAAPAGIDGESLLGDTGGRIARAVYGVPPAERFERDVPGFRQSPFHTSIRSAYDGAHHLLRWGDGREELYHVPTDPLEQRDLAPRGGPVLPRLRKWLPEE